MRRNQRPLLELEPIASDGFRTSARLAELFVASERRLDIADGQVQNGDLGGPFDVVFLRNVLIYFDVPTKQDILRKVRALMRPDGWLFLGATETTLGVDPGWERVALGRTSAYRPIA